jgi:hypothetical protein
MRVKLQVNDTLGELLGIRIGSPEVQSKSFGVDLGTQGPKEGFVLGADGTEVEHRVHEGRVAVG